MYESFFGLTGLPFQVSPDPSFFFEAKVHREALEALRRGLLRGAPLMVLTGEIGAGKTTLLRTLLSGVDPSSVSTVHISGTHLDADTLSDTVSIELGMGTSGDARTRRDAVMQRLGSGALPTLLVIDEAQHLADSAFEMLEALGEAASTSVSRLQVVLVGQPEFRALLNAPQRTRFRERIQVDRHLGPMDRAETRSYVEHRLRKVGWTGQPEFGDDAFHELHARTAGIPRRLNVLCGRLMLSAFVGPQRRIDASAVSSAAAALRAEFDLDSGAPHSAQPTVESTVEASGPTNDAPVPDAPVAVVAWATDRAPLPALTPPVPREGPILCVVGGVGDHVQAAAVLRALRARRAVPRAQLVRAFDNKAFQLNSELFSGTDPEDVTSLGFGLAELPYERREIDLERCFERMVEQHRPSAFVVFNGSNLAWACAEVAHQAGVPVVHIGAGQRTEHRLTPDDSVGMAVDQLSTQMFTSRLEFEQGLRDEAVPEERVHCVGSLAMDALRAATLTLGGRGKGPSQRLVPPDFLTNRHGYGLVWLSKAANIQDPHRLQALLALLAAVSRDLPLVWSVSPLARKFSKTFGLRRVIAGERIACVPTQPHFAAVDLMRNATCVLTDSWRMQDEALGLSVPCLMIGENAKRFGGDRSPSAVYVGTSSVAASRAIWDIAYSGRGTSHLPFAWDGKSADRIAAFVERALEGWKADGEVLHRGRLEEA